MGDDPFMRNQNAAVRGATKGQNRTNVLQLKMMGQAHPTGLTPTLLKLFEARPPLEFKPPPEKRKMPSYAGIAQFVSHFAEKGDPEYAPPVPVAETPAERKARIHKLRLEKGAAKAAEEFENYDPSNDPNVSGDPYKTLFVARLNYETSESKVKREFESYGPIKRVGTSQYTQADKETGKPRGYAFIEYVHTRDMKGAYKQADGRKIDGRRVLVDVERGRTVPNWRPRRLGGGLGTSRVGGEDVPQREVQQTGRSSQSAEPRAKDDRHSEREREKSRERGREREREREKSHERPKDREREDRHHKDRGKEKERDRDREHRRDGERDRDRDRGRERDRGRDRGRDKERDRDRDLGQEHDRDHYRGGRDREYEDYGDNERERSRDRRSEKDYDQAEPEDGRYEQHYEYDRHDNRYDQIDEDDYRYDRGASESRDYRHSERSRSREYGI